ncbi:lipoprotein [mine drainage metagenome]|uniref:Lipoprotein n=1 Tax=mine drainage metagenome TaxID=410659 RepID=A0A1J5RB15_9ZZZZ
MNMKLAANAAAVILGLAGCSGMSTQDKNTAIGGVIGHEISK